MRDALIQGLRRWRLQLRGVDIDPSTRVGRQVSTGNTTGRLPGSLRIGPTCEIGAGVELNPWTGHITLGRHVFVGPHAVIYGQGGVDIGDHTLIAMHCCIVSSNHTVPAPGILIRDKPDVLLPTRIGSDVWLGAGVTVLGGVTIGDGCVVGAGAVVSTSLPPYAIAVGVPARIVGTREQDGQTRGE